MFVSDRRIQLGDIPGKVRFCDMMETSEKNLIIWHWDNFDAWGGKPYFLLTFLTLSFQISFFLSSYIVPLTLISILYVGMLIRLWHSVPGSKVSAESRRGKKRVTRMVVFVVLGEF